MAKQNNNNKIIVEINNSFKLFSSRRFSSSNIDSKKIYCWTPSGQVKSESNHLSPEMQVDNISEVKDVSVVALTILPRENIEDRSLEMLFKAHPQWENVFPSVQISSIPNNLLELSEFVKSASETNLGIAIEDIIYIGGLITFKKSPKYHESKCYIFPVFILRATYQINSLRPTYKYLSIQSQDENYHSPNGDVYQTLKNYYSGWHVFYDFAYEYDITLSYAEEDISCVKDIAEILGSDDYEVFHDICRKDKTWVHQEFLYDETVFAERARYSVLFLSDNYWKGLHASPERFQALTRALQNDSRARSYLLALQIDDTTITGITDKLNPVKFSEVNLDAIYSALRKRLGINYSIKKFPGIKKGGFVNQMKQVRKTDILILTALKDEYEQLIKVERNIISPGWQIKKERGREFAFCRLKCEDGKTFSIRATWCTKMGESTAAVTASTLVERWSPLVLAMSGVCAGRRGSVNQGDVIFADRIWKYDSGKHKTEKGDDGIEREVFECDPYQYNLLDTWKQHIQSIEGTFKLWWNDLPLPISLQNQELWVLLELNNGNNPLENSEQRKIHCPNWSDVILKLRKEKKIKQTGLSLSPSGKRYIEDWKIVNPDCTLIEDDPKIVLAPIGTGSAVREDEEIFKKISKDMRKVKGIEMEAAALGSVAEYNDLKLIVAKGVQDYGGKDKDDRYRKFAARSSAEWLITMLHNVVTEIIENSSENVPSPQNYYERTAHSHNTIPKVVSHIDPTTGTHIVDSVSL